MTVERTPARIPTRMSLIILLIVAPVAMLVGVIAGFATGLQQSYQYSDPQLLTLILLIIEMVVAIGPAIVLLVVSIRRYRNRIFAVLAVVGIIVSGGSLFLGGILTVPNIVLSTIDYVDFAVSQSHGLAPTETAHTAKQLAVIGDSYATRTASAAGATPVRSADDVPTFINSCGLSTRNKGKLASSAGLPFLTSWSEGRVERAIAAKWRADGLNVSYENTSAAAGEPIVRASGGNYSEITATWAGSTTGNDAAYNLVITYDSVCVTR